MSALPERSWPPNTQPTPEQFVAWFLSGDDEQRLDIAGRVLRDNEMAHQCFVANHDGAIRQLAELPRLIAEAEERGAARVRERVEAVCAYRLTLTQDGTGRRSDHWRGHDYADGWDMGTEDTVAYVRAALTDPGASDE